MVLLGDEWLDCLTLTYDCSRIVWLLSSWKSDKLCLAAELSRLCPIERANQGQRNNHDMQCTTISGEDLGIAA